MRHSNLPPALKTRSVGRRSSRAARATLPPGLKGQKQSVGTDSCPGARPALLLACGNSLRQDDGVGLRIAEAAERNIPSARLRVVAAQQFTPEMAADLAETDLVIFVDACIADEPGAIRIFAVDAHTAAPPPAPRGSLRLETHRLDPAALLQLAETLFGHRPARAFALTVGAGSFGYGDELTARLRQAVPRAVRLVTNLVTALTRPA